MEKGQLVLVSGPSGTGKTSLVDALIESPNIVKGVSLTTRDRRDNEVDGEDYRFVSQEEFKQTENRGGLAECAEIYGWKYGIRTYDIDYILNRGHSCAVVVGPSGAAELRSKFKGTKSIFLLPPSKEKLKERLVGRAIDSGEQIETRLKSAYNDIIRYPEYNYLVVNGEFDKALCQMFCIINGHGQAFRQAVQCVVLTDLIKALMLDAATLYNQP